MALGRSESKESKVSRKEALRCKYENQGMQCSLMGDISPSGGEGARFYCAYHYDMLARHPEERSYYKFQTWLAEYQEIYSEKKYCLGDQFHNNSEKTLWRLMGNRIE